MTAIQRLLQAVGILTLVSLLHACRQQNANQPADSGTATTPTRIVSLAPSITETLFALGLDEYIVGVTNYCDYPAKAQEKPKVGGFCDPNFEVLLALKPDLVVLLKTHSNTEQKLRDLGLNVLVVAHTSVDDILHSITRIGERCGRPDESRAMVAGMQDRIKTIQSRTAGLERPRILVSIGRNMGSGGLKDVYIAGQDGFFSHLLELAGGQNAYTRTNPAFPMLSLEGIMELNPDIIIDLVADLHKTNLTVDQVVTEWQVAETVDAVRSKRIHVLTDDFVTVPGPRFILLLEQFAQVIHPELTTVAIQK